MQAEQLPLITAYQSCELSEATTYDWPAQARRMTASQKSALVAVDRLRNGHEEFWHNFICDPNSRIVHATIFGEVQSISDVGERILDSDYLVSPISFQNSVANAAPATLCRHFDINIPYHSYTYNYLAADEALHRCWYDLRHQSPKAILFLHCEESIAGTEGFSEVMFIANRPWYTAKKMQLPAGRWEFVPEGALQEYAKEHFRDFPTISHIEEEQKNPHFLAEMNNEVSRRKSTAGCGRSLSTYFKVVT